MRFDPPRGFHPHIFYGLDARTARGAAATWLDFWDVIFAHTDADTGLVALHIGRDITAPRILSRPTFYKWMRHALATQTLLPQDGPIERGEYLCRLGRWPPADVFWKARGYVTHGWIALIRPAPAKRVLNVLCWLVSADAACTAHTELTFDLSTVRRASKAWLGQPIPHRHLRDSLARLAELGIIRRLDGGPRYGFQPLALHQPAPGRRSLAQQVAERVGLHPEADADWVQLLADFVHTGHHRLRETPAIYRHFCKFLPDTSPATLAALRETLHHHARRGKVGYRDVLADFQRAAAARARTVRSLPLTLRPPASGVDQKPVAWPAGTTWTRLTSVSLACDLHSQPGEQAAPPQLYLWHRGAMHRLGECVPRSRHGIRQMARFDLTPLLNDLRPDEPLTLVVATASPTPPGRLRAFITLGIADPR